MTRHRKREFFRIHKLKRTYNKATNTFTFNISYETAPATRTQRTTEVAEAFGLGADTTQKFTLYDNTEIHIRPTDIVLITGESGSGKSVLLKALKADLKAEAADTRDLPIIPNQPIIETLGTNTAEALALLSKVGLNDAFLFLRNYTELSDGQKHRFQIARLAETAAHWWLLDEFTSTLDRDTAKTVAFNLQRLARKMGKAVVAATTHTDLIADLAPNVHVRKRFGKHVEVNYNPDAKAENCSLTREIRIEQGTTADYKQLSQFHYRNARCPPARSVFTLKREGEICGAIVYAYPSPTCFGRSRVWKGTLRELQREVSVISRVVLHPKYRGIGLGEKLVRDTLAFCGTRFVEAVAVMVRVNPFFEKAGMRRVAESKPSLAVSEALEKLGQLGFEAALLPCVGFVEKRLSQVGCGKVVALLLELSLRDAAVRKRVANLPSVYPKHEEFARKICGLNNAGLAEALKRLSFLAQRKLYLFWEKPESSCARNSL
jgi:ABC-type ATPase with predicted acetyltransferase domain